MLSGRDIVVVGRVVKGQKLIGIKIRDLSLSKPIFITGSKDINLLFKNNNVLNCKYYGGCLHSVWTDLDMRMLSTYDDNFQVKKLGSYSEDSIIVKAISIIDNKISKVCGALISGAINNPESVKAEEHAELYYQEIRKMRNDVSVIASKTGKSIDEIQRVKRYLFLDNHNIRGVLQPFDPDFSIAQSWQRLLTPNMKPEPHDFLLIEHELAEIQMQSLNPDCTQDEAHREVSKIYDYRAASEKYYRERRVKEENDRINRNKKNR